MKKLLCSWALVWVLAGLNVYAAGGPQVVNFWYNNTGEEAKVYEQAIAAYNASQSIYRVERLSVNERDIKDIVKTGNIQFIIKARELFPEDLWDTVLAGVYQDRNRRVCRGACPFSGIIRE
ncbi:MAG: hypothetical protein LBK43_01290 [Treponema sp.]|jgi:hypothetical protein|nr:hypothetical protein [Treponema sp.]